MREGTPSELRGRTREGCGRLETDKLMWTRCFVVYEREREAVAPRTGTLLARCRASGRGCGAAEHLPSCLDSTRVLVPRGARLL
jgi:hypothetical protein